MKYGKKLNTVIGWDSLAQGGPKQEVSRWGGGRGRGGGHLLKPVCFCTLGLLLPLQALQCQVAFGLGVIFSHSYIYQLMQALRQLCMHLLTPCSHQE